MMSDDMVIERRSIEVDGNEIAAVLTIPASGGVDRLAVMAHGGPGGVKEGPANLYVDLADQLARQHIASIRFDFLGAGESGGDYVDMTIQRQTHELRAVIRDVHDRLRPRSLTLIGESYGATIAILALKNIACKALVLLWPAIWLLDKTFESYVTPDQLRHAEEHGYIEAEGERVGLTFLRELQERQDVSGDLEGVTLPVLFVHGRDDQEVPFQQSLRGAEIVKGLTNIVLVPDGDHCLERPGERAIVYREVVDWLVRHS